MQTPVRFRDQEGFLWQAVELRSGDGASAHGELFFLSGGSTRCLREYPEDWSVALWSELDQMKERARPLSVDITRPAGQDRTVEQDARA